MRWNVFLAMISIVMLLLCAGIGLIEPMTAAEAIAEDLAPQIGADEDLVRSSLERILRSGSVRRTFVHCAPLAFLSFLLTARLIADVATRRMARRNVD